MIRKYKFSVDEYGKCNPICKHRKDRAVGSIACQCCNYNKGQIKRVVHCSHPIKKFKKENKK
ncbi:MAG: hypothetical protein IPL26_29975 [Leptospiraceae bacterium]|nr:hypothetical protein [Leptospiraceae bacterium]